MPALTKQQLDSAQELATAAIAALRSAEGIHPGTVVAGTARMAGTYLFRSFRLGLRGVQPGQVVLSDKANALGPTLILLIQHCARALEAHIAFSVAALGFVEGTKTAPDPVVQSNRV